MARVSFGLTLVVMVVASISASNPCTVAMEGNIKLLQKQLVKIERMGLNPLTSKIIRDAEACVATAYPNPKVLECRKKTSPLVLDIMKNGPSPTVLPGPDSNVQLRMKTLISEIENVIKAC